MIVSCGVAFTIGGYIYTTEEPNPIPGKFGFHEIWHVAVIVGAAFHYAVMYFYVLSLLCRICTGSQCKWPSFWISLVL